MYKMVIYFKIIRYLFNAFIEHALNFKNINSMHYEYQEKA